jgi:hypothetical protein
VRAVAGQPATVRLQVATDGGTAEAADAAPTVTVVAGDGTTVLYSNQASTADGAGTGAYKWVLPAQSQLDTLLATWTWTVSSVPYSATVPIKVVGRRLADPYLCRQDPTVAGLALTDAQLLDLIDAVEDKIEEFIGYPPILSGARQEWDVLRGTLTDALYISGTVNGLPYGWGAGRMLIPGVKKPVAAGYQSGTAALYAAIPAGAFTSVQIAGDQVGTIGTGYTLELASSVTAVTTSSGSWDGTKTTYTVGSTTAPSLITAGQSVAWAGPAGGPGAIYGGTINGVALDPIADLPNLVIINGALAWKDYRPWISGRYSLWLTHGDVIPRNDLCRAARKLVSFYAQSNNYPDRAAQVITEGATIVFNFPDADHPTGIPEVDAVLRDARLQSVI